MSERLVFEGAPGRVTIEERREKYRRREVAWSLDGREWFVDRNRFKALLHASWVKGFRMCDADWRLVEGNPEP